MLYRTFAIATLLAAPLIVLAAQTFLPSHMPIARSQSVVVPLGNNVASKPEPAPYAPPPIEPASPNPPAFGQPIAEAGRPMLDLGDGTTNADTESPSNDAPPE